MSWATGLYLIGVGVFTALYAKTESSHNFVGQVVGAILAALWPITIIGTIIYHYGKRKS